MCFSATASFVVGGSLTALGAVTLKRAKNRCEIPFAAIPLMFGIQQIIEGVLWLSVYGDAELLKTVMTYMFTMFSHVLWPVYVPFAIAMMERDIAPWRREVMWGFRFTGLVVAIHLLVLITTQSLTAEVNGHIIYVSPFFYEWPMMVLYVAATCIVAFFSSHRLIRLFGLITLLFFLVAYWFYTEAFFSVWCFFAAIISLIIYLHFSQAKTHNQQSV
ncbi:MAG: DUF6629 family protein [Mariprofundaceae bacterium]